MNIPHLGEGIEGDRVDWGSWRREAINPEPGRRQRKQRGWDILPCWELACIFTHRRLGGDVVAGVGHGVVGKDLVQDVRLHVGRVGLGGWRLAV